MLQPKRVLCVMDLALAGRSSLAVVLPVLSACGVQACPLPAALYSTHTGGFGAVEKQDEADFCQRALAHFARENISFDAVYIGYLASADQFAMAAAAQRQYPSARCVVDPALGDDGKPYNGITEDTIQRMAALCGKADLLCPNLTESALLCGEDPAITPDEAGLQARLATLAQNGKSVLITGADTPGGGHATYGRAKGESFSIPSQHLPQRYPGTGDLFCAAVLGRLLGGDGLHTAAQAATRFVHAAVAATYAAGAPARHGVWFEPYLPMLAPGRPKGEGTA